ncbi:DUF7933 domain-containing protein [Streptomyces griseosporeus]|uniref:DUF7933 domain-containing protein n=1 Tax=Streptomyces griseosporeus TaxID=1910 RepID=UPI003789371F
MATRALRRNIATLGTTLVLGVALSFAVFVSPAHADSQLQITKSQVGGFVRGGQGVYRITVVNTGDQPTTGRARMTDELPAGFTVQLQALTVTGPASCVPGDALGRVECLSDRPLAPSESYTVQVTVNVPADAPCTVTNTATVADTTGIAADSASVTTSIPGDNCNGGGTGNGGGSLLPISLSGLIPMFNNITTNNNVNSPSASNVSHQTFDVTSS